MVGMLLVETLNPFFDVKKFLEKSLDDVVYRNNQRLEEILVMHMRDRHRDNKELASYQGELHRFISIMNPNGVKYCGYIFSQCMHKGTRRV